MNYVAWVLKAVNRSNLRPEKVQVRGKQKTYQSTRWKGNKKEPVPVTHKDSASATAGVDRVPKMGGQGQGQGGKMPGQKPKGPKGGGEMPRNPTVFGNKPEPKLGNKGEGLKPTGSFHDKHKLPQYQLPEEAKSWKMQTIHTLEQIKKVYGRREPGEGKQMSIASREDLDLILHHTRFACISAGRNPDDPEDQKKTDAEIEGRYAELKNKAKALGFCYTDTIGKYGVPEETVMVMCHDADLETALSLGKEFHQQSVMVAENGNGKVVRTTGTGEEKPGAVMGQGQGFDYVDDADDFYTAVQVGGEWTKFRFNIEFAQKAIKFIWWVLRGRRK